MMHPRNAYASPPDFLGLARSYPTLRPQYVLVFDFQFVVSESGDAVEHLRWVGRPS